MSRLSSARTQPRTRGPVAEVAPETDSASRRSELASLEARGLLARRGALCAGVTDAAGAPATLLEIGRLREISFRGVGEGTMSEIDLDRFDAGYLHLLVWDRRDARVLGAYRLAPTWDDDGPVDPAALYTHTLFDYGGDFLQRLGPALELGRAFVRPESQRSGMVLPLLWKALGHFVAARPHFRRLFGPVSISARHSEPARAHLAASLLDDLGDTELRRRVRAREPAPLRRGHARDAAAPPCVAQRMTQLAIELERLDPGGPGIPMLIDHYARLGGRFLSFNLDRAFQDAVDGLVVVDLLAAPERALAFYLGREGAAAFRSYHEPTHAG